MKNFPNDKIDLHEAYCCRNIRRCQYCEVMIDIKDMEEHIVIFMLFFRKNCIRRKLVDCVIKNFSQVSWLDTNLHVLEDQYYVNIAKITMRIQSFQGMNRCVVQGLNLVHNARDLWHWKILQLIKVDAKEEINREENREMKYHKIHIFLGREIKLKG